MSTTPPQAVTAKPKKPFYKRAWFIVLAVIVLVIVVATATKGGGDKKTENAAKPEPAAAASETASAAKDEGKDKTGKIGQPLTVGKTEFTVNAVNVSKDAGENEYMKETANGQFIILDVTVKNNENESLSVADDFFKLKLGDKEYSASTNASVALAADKSEFLYKQINPGNSATGKIAFDVPDDVAADLSKLSVQVQTGLFGAEKGLISLAQ